MHSYFLIGVNEIISVAWFRNLNVTALHKDHNEILESSNIGTLEFWNEAVYTMRKQWIYNVLSSSACSCMQDLQHRIGVYLLMLIYGKAGPSRYQNYANEVYMCKSSIIKFNCILVYSRCWTVELPFLYCQYHNTILNTNITIFLFHSYHRTHADLTLHT